VVVVDSLDLLGRLDEILADQRVSQSDAVVPSRSRALRRIITCVVFSPLTP
jgi:hypothetical protein